MTSTTYLVLCTSAYISAEYFSCKQAALVKSHDAAPPSTPHYLALQIAFLALSWYCSSASQFIFTAVCWQCPLTSIFPSKKMGSVFFCLSGIFTPELGNLKNSAYSPLWGFRVPVDFHSWFGYTF